MSADRWSEVLIRITSREACDIDEIAGAFDRRRNPVGRAIFPACTGQLMPQMAFKNVEFACIGVRVVEKRSDVANFAMHLTTLALEKDVEIIVLNHLSYSGLERFGFRCERITGDTPEARAACEEQIRRFWNIEIVI